jgi:hypothetical protein
MLEEQVRLSKIKGVCSGNNAKDRQDNVKQLIQGQTIYFKPEPDNPVDSNAVKLFLDPEMKRELGYVDSQLLKDMIGFEVDTVMVRSIGSATGNRFANWGANIMIVFRKKEA